MRKHERQRVVGIQGKDQRLGSSRQSKADTVVLDCERTTVNLSEVRLRRIETDRGGRDKKGICLDSGDSAIQVVDAPTDLAHTKNLGSRSEPLQG